MGVVTSPGIDPKELFCRLAEQYQTTLLHTCCVYLRDRSLAEDAVQETFLKAYKAIGSFRGECSEKTWLVRIAMNTCHDMKRSGWFRHMLLLDLNEDIYRRGPSFWDHHPEIETQDGEYFAFADRIKLIAEMHPDLFVIDSLHANLYDLVQTNMLADLSESQIIRNATDRLRPDIKALVSAEDGKILAVPLEVHAWPLLWNQEAWDAAGYTVADVPRSYPELLDFLKNWIDRITKEKVNDVCSVYTSKYASVDRYRDVGWLTSVLLNTWENQSAYAGETLNFDTPEFIVLLERTRRVGLALFNAEPGMGKRKKMMQLFNSEGGNGMGTALEYGLSHSIPLRANLQQPELIHVYAELLGIHAHSQWKAEAIAYIEDRLEREKTTLQGDEKYIDFQPGTYEMGDAEIYSEGWVRDMNNFKGHFVFAPTNTYDSYYKAIKNFMEGDISAAKLAKKISVPKLDPNK